MKEADESGQLQVPLWGVGQRALRHMNTIGCCRRQRRRHSPRQPAAATANQVGQLCPTYYDVAVVVVRCRKGSRYCLWGVPSSPHSPSGIDWKPYSGGGGGWGRRGAQVK